MADLAASDVTVVVEQSRRTARSRSNRVKITFGDGAKTYPSGGIPLPTDTAFGMKKNLEYLVIFDLDDSTGLIWKYDKDNKKLRGYWPTGGGGTAPTAAATVPIVSSGAASATAVDATTPTIRAGQGKEFVSATTTIAAQTLYAEAVGQ